MLWQMMKKSYLLLLYVITMQEKLMLNGVKNLLKQCILTDWVLMLSILKKELVSKCSIKQKKFLNQLVLNIYDYL